MLRELLVVSAAITAVPLMAQETAPWGRATIQAEEYRPGRVIYDLTSGSPGRLSNVLDRASFLSALYGADPFAGSIVIIIHGEAIPLFTGQAYAQYRDLMNRAQSLSVGNIIEFRMCQASAKMMGVEAKDVHGFVTMVPMADAEIIKLQHEGYAYMR